MELHNSSLQLYVHVCMCVCVCVCVCVNIGKPSGDSLTSLKSRKFTQRVTIDIEGRCSLFAQYNNTGGEPL